MTFKLIFFPFFDENFIWTIKLQYTINICYHNVSNDFKNQKTCASQKRGGGVPLKKISFNDGRAQDERQN